MLGADLGDRLHSNNIIQRNKMEVAHQYRPYHHLFYMFNCACPQLRGRLGTRFTPQCLIVERYQYVTSTSIVGMAGKSCILTQTLASFYYNSFLSFGIAIFFCLFFFLQNLFWNSYPKFLIEDIMNFRKINRSCQEIRNDSVSIWNTSCKLNTVYTLRTNLTTTI